MEKEIAVKTTRIGELATPEPKSRSCWTPIDDKGRIKNSKMHNTTKVVSKLAKLAYI